MLQRRLNTLFSSAGMIWLIVVSAGLSLPLAYLGPNEEAAIVAHRGASGYAPENTMAAFELAVQMDADYIELDVRMSKDGELVVLHDETVERTTNGAGNVRDYTLSELKALDAGSYFAPGYAKETIPTLQEVLDRFQGRIGLLIEVKASPSYTGLEDKVVRLFEQYDDRENIVIQSFDAELARAIYARLPDIPVGVLISAEQPPLTDAALDDIASYAAYINYNVELLDAETVKKVHDRNRKVMAWTIRKETDEARIKRLGVDGIITDYPAWGLKAQVERLAAESR